MVLSRSRPFVITSYLSHQLVKNALLPWHLDAMSDRSLGCHNFVGEDGTITRTRLSYVLPIEQTFYQPHGLGGTFSQFGSFYGTYSVALV